ncbi:MAG: excinuclease ABC subunit UvrC [Bacteroidia bacterium]|nr:excinuclease ABC subunit UvrC [Bacteroidia bacterium]MDW8014699.1 excinuclease ABC subunit UvrC [Bacteroidia bacterium]
MDIEAAKETLPDAPGVYKFLNTRGEVIYVGKARNLRRRVLSYFSRAEDPKCDYKTRNLVRHIAQVEWILTDTEWDALLLENNLIKYYNPRFNVLLKDGKTYPYLCITAESYPRLLFLRQKVYPDAKYYGPFPGGGMLRSLMELFQTLYRLRDCDLKLTPEGVAAGRFRACVKYYIGNCAAPCIGKQSHSAYLEAVQEIQRLLEGEWELVLAEIDRQRQQAVETLEFERAHELKKRLEQLRAYQQRSLIADAALGDIEVLSFVTGVKISVVHHLRVQKGRVVASHTWQFPTRDWEETPYEVLERIIGEIAADHPHPPHQILLDGWPSDKALPEWHNFTFLFPEESSALTALAVFCRKTALSIVEQKNAFLTEKTSKQEATLQELAALLKLPKFPLRIECIDNSHIQGSHMVSGVAVFIRGEPRRSEYRRYIHENLSEGNDFEAIRAVIRRRYEKRLRAGMPLPDLLLIDGGKGQLAAACEAMQEIGLNVPVFALAKKKEEIFSPDRKSPLFIDKRSPVLRLLQRIRDESHETAVGFHRQRRDAAALRTLLLSVPGIGTKCAEKLLTEFGSLERLRTASLEDLCRILGKRRGESLHSFLQHV